MVGREMPEKERMLAFARKHWVKIVLIVLLAAFVAVKIPTFGNAYVNRDEPLYAWQSLVIYNNPADAFLPEVNYWYPPSIAVLAAPLNAFFEPPLPVRIVSFGFALMALLFTYMIGKKIFSEKAGLVAVLLLMLSPTFFYFASKAVLDIALTALGAVIIYILLTLNKRRAVLLPLVITAMYIIRPHSLVILPPTVVFLLAKYRKGFSRKQTAGILLALGFMVTGAFLISREAIWMTPSYIINLGLNYFWFSLMTSSNFFWRIAGIPLCLAVLVAAFELRKKPNSNNGLLLLWFLLVSLPFAIAKLMRDRYYLLGLPALAVLGGEGIASLIEKRKYKSIAAILIAILCFAVISPAYQNFFYHSVLEMGYSKQRVALDNWLSKNAGREDRVIILSDEFTMRAIRLSAEKTLPDPRNQVVSIPEKSMFEEILKDKRTRLVVIFDDITMNAIKASQKPFSESMKSWVSKGFELEQYLESQGFKKVLEIPQEEDLLTETYFIYIKEKQTNTQ